MAAAATNRGNGSEWLRAAAQALKHLMRERLQAAVWALPQGEGSLTPHLQAAELQRELLPPIQAPAPQPALPAVERSLLPPAQAAALLTALTCFLSAPQQAAAVLCLRIKRWTCAGSGAWLAGGG